MPFNGNKYYAIKDRYLRNEGALIPCASGIYLGTRGENNITYFYVGQAKDLNKRRLDYYCIQCGINYPTRHFEASLKKHKDGKFQILELCPVEQLDEREKFYIDLYNAKPNHITRNDKIAGQDMVQSNAKRINQVIDNYEKDLIVNLKRLCIHFNIDTNTNEIKLEPKKNKYAKNGYNKISLKAFIEITNGLKGLLNNDKPKN